MPPSLSFKSPILAARQFFATPRLDTKSYQQCRTLLSQVLPFLRDSENAKQYVRDEAQALANFFSEVLDNPDTLTPRETRYILKFLTELANLVNVVPRSLKLEGVQCNLKTPIDGGGFGTIYRGTHKKQNICVKVVNNSSKMTHMAQLKELIIGAHLSHPNILSFRGFYFFGGDNRNLAIVSPWMQLGNLLKFMEGNPTSPRMPLLRCILSGLQYLHGLEIVHADLKAINVLVSGKDQAIIADFGISRVVMTLAGKTAYDNHATLRWKAPELCFGDTELPTKESDIWAFGCICYEVATGGEPPFNKCKNEFLQNALATGHAFSYESPPESGQGSNEGELKEIRELARICREYDPGCRPSAEELLGKIGQPDVSGDHGQRENGRKVKVDYEQVHNLLQRLQQTKEPASLVKSKDLYSECRALVEEVTACPDTMQRLIGLELSETREIVEFLSKLLDDHDLSVCRHHGAILKLLTTLVGSAKIIPSPLIFKTEDLRCLLTGPLDGYHDRYRGLYNGRSVLVKTIPLSDKSHYNQGVKAKVKELTFLAHSSHTNIYPFLGTVLRDQLCFVSPWIAQEGKILDYLKKLPSAPRIPLIYDIISGLDFLHESDIVHGDLMAANIVICGSGRVMLADIASSWFAETLQHRMTTRGPGPVHWKAPELMAQGPSREADIWAFACTCHEVFTGLPPFSTTFPNMLIQMLLRGTAPYDTITLEDIPSNEAKEDIESVWSEVQKCWNQEPNDRPTSTDVLRVIAGLINRSNSNQSASSPLSTGNVSSSASSNPPIVRRANTVNIDYPQVWDILQRVQRSAIPEGQTEE